MTEVKKGREGKLGARPRAREKRGEEGVSLPPFLGGLQFFWMEYGYWGGLKRQKMTLGGGGGLQVSFKY